MLLLLVLYLISGQWVHHRPFFVEIDPDQINHWGFIFAIIQKFINAVVFGT